MFELFHGFLPCARTLNESQSSRNSPEQAEGRPLQVVRRNSRHLSLLTAFLSALVCADPRQVLPGGEAGFLPAIQSGTKHWLWVCMFTREAFRTI